MGRPRSYPVETQARAFELLDEVDEEGKKVHTRQSVAELLEVPMGTLENWVTRRNAERRTREQEQPPRAGPSDRRAERAAPPEVPGPVPLDLGQVSGFIEGAYKLAGKGLEGTDEILGEVLQEHAEAAATAWVHYIESEPKVAALLQRLMVGTPLGEVIGVHVSMVFSYTVARQAARRAVEEAARRAREADEAERQAAGIG